MSETSKWDQRYSEPGYAYGTDPNDFLVASLEHLPAGGEVLCLAEGEGRNSVYLALQGFKVTAVDSSSVAMKKTEALAKKHGVVVDTVVADLAQFTFKQQYDAIISIFCHLPPVLRKSVHRLVPDSLKAGGVFLLEGYTPKQLEHGTGGPPIPELLMNFTVLEQELTGLRIIHGLELEREIHEGKLHNGVGAVVQFIGQKIQNNTSFQP
ncbi:cyclopropane-fatty-acyl-phospholipid synthase family protein [Desulforhopalus sp. IMCC35007]|uniref:SAM-dependent methyltransferase n=1 Tax=Desulforhopalus sp. IMCC35007 TaxID=2569543 RepID=UPI0010AE705D|nr:class I SAM-dependent methyltransferase [Desulforhopalus sp. IMCC35007]TKB05740.1 methyltransferase domain-containing protein [Desulforhopalus sp. IMCC35007]